MRNKARVRSQMSENYSRSFPGALRHFPRDIIFATLCGFNNKYAGYACKNCYFLRRTSQIQSVWLKLQKNFETHKIGVPGITVLLHVFPKFIFMAFPGSSGCFSGFSMPGKRQFGSSGFSRIVRTMAIWWYLPATLKPLIVKDFKTSENLVRIIFHIRFKLKRYGDKSTCRHNELSHDILFHFLHTLQQNKSQGWQVQITNKSKQS